MDNKSDSPVHVGTPAFLLSQKGRRDSGDEEVKQGSTKRQKRDEIAEEIKNKFQENINSDASDNSEESYEETQEKKMEVLMDAASNAQECDLKNVENDSSSDSPDDDNDKSSDFIDKPHMATNPVKSSENNSEEEIEKNASKTPQVNPETLPSLEEQSAGSKTIYTKNLSYSVERADLENLFKGCGKIVDVRLHTDYEGRFRGFGHVEFATEEAALKALQLNNTELLRCPIRVGVARERHQYTPNRSFHANNFSNLNNRFQRSERIQPVNGSEISEDGEQETEEKASKDVQKFPTTTWKDQNATSKTICARNLSYRVERDDMEVLFKECGEIVDIRLQTDHEGRFRGFGHVQFATAEAAQKALELDNTTWLGRCISVGIAQEKGEYTSNRSFSNWSNSFYKCERTDPIKKAEYSEYCEEEIEGKALQNPWKRSKLLATPEEQNASPKTIYIKNLSFKVEEADVENHFKECGEIVDVRLHRDSEGRLRGFGHVQFATTEAALKALELDNTELFRRCIVVQIARGKCEHTWNRSNSFQKHERFQPMKATVCLEDCEEEIEKKALRSPHESPNTLATLKEQNAASKTIYVGNLSYGVERVDLENLFEECGEIVYVHLHTDHEGRHKGFGHVEFSTAEAAQKALELDHTELFGRPIRVDLAREKGYTYSRSNWSNSLQKGERIQSLTVYVKGFDSSLVEEEIKASLEEHFGSCGEIMRILIPKFHFSGASKGFALLDFKDVDSVKRALQLDQTVMEGCTLLVEQARPRRDNRGVDDNRGGGGGGHQFGGGDGNGSNSSGWGERSGGGWHSLFFP